MKKFFRLRQHPIKILGYTTKSFWLLIIPLARSLVAVKFDIATWLRGWWLDILVIVAIFIFAFLRWAFVTYEIKDDEIVANTGFFGMFRVYVPYNKICCVSITQGALYRPFKAYKVYIDTNSGSDKATDLVLSMKPADLEALKSFSASPHANVKFVYTPRKRNLLIFSLLFSSTLSGVIIFTTFLVQASRIVGREIEQRFFYKLSSYAKYFTLKLPKYVVALAGVIIAGWLFSFCVNIVRHWSFTVKRDDNNIVITSGFVTKRFHQIPVDKINYIDIQQSLLMKIFKICSVQIHASGYGKGSREIAVLIPVTTLSVVKRTMSLLTPEFKSVPVQIKPLKRNIMRYIMPPLVLCLSIPVVCVLGSYFLPNWTEIFRFAGIIFEVPALWLLIVKASSILTTGIGISNSYANLSYCSLYKFHTVLVRTDKISKVSVYQTPFQYMANNISFKFNVHGESKLSHKIKNFPQKIGEDFLRENFTNIS